MELCGSDYRLRGRGSQIPGRANMNSGEASPSLPSRWIKHCGLMLLEDMQTYCDLSYIVLTRNTKIILVPYISVRLSEQYVK
jgi:hypothetical protein